MLITHSFVNPQADGENATITRPSNWNAAHVAVSVVDIYTDSQLLDTANEIVICNKVSAMTITLPVAVGSYKVYFIKNINIGVVTVDGNGADTLDGELTQPIDQWEAITIVDYASNKWSIL